MSMLSIYAIRHKFQLLSAFKVFMRYLLDEVTKVEGALQVPYWENVSKRYIVHVIVVF